MLPIFDLATDEGREGFQQRLKQLRQTVDLAGPQAEAVARIVADVAERGDAAVISCMQRFTDPDFQPDRLRVDPAECRRARDELDPALRRAIDRSIENVRTYQQHILPRPPAPLHLDGAELGLRFAPMASAGLAVPGGTAVLFSTLIMLAVPALVAGVPAAKLSVANPPPTRRAGEPAGDVSPVVLAVCAMLGIERVYRIGGAQGMAALALGTETIEPVDMLAGPGNVYVQLAKAQLAGRVGMDGFYGPSEIVTLADRHADPARVASDLLAQAEHDPGKCFLISWERAVIERIQHAVAEQLPQRNRSAAIERSLAEESAAILAPDEAAAFTTADRLAGEHVNLAVADPAAALAKLSNGGEFFLGDAAPVAAGDYLAGPSHCLPTGTTARFGSGVSVYTFLKRSGTVRYPEGMPAEVAEAIATLAETEGLDAHAHSARLRTSK